MKNKKNITNKDYEAEYIFFCLLSLVIGLAFFVFVLISVGWVSILILLLILIAYVFFKSYFYQKYFMEKK